MSLLGECKIYKGMYLVLCKTALLGGRDHCITPGIRFLSVTTLSCQVRCEEYSLRVI